MLFQGVFGLINKERVGVVALRVRQQVEGLGLLFGVEQLAGAQPHELVIEGGAVLELGEPEFAGGVLDVGESVASLGPEDGGKVIRP